MCSTKLLADGGQRRNGGISGFAQENICVLTMLLTEDEDGVTTRDVITGFHCNLDL